MSGIGLLIRQSLGACAGSRLGHALILLGTLLLLAPHPLIAATIRHVTKTGHNNPQCTFAHPCLTVAHAIHIAQPGDTIQIGAGTFVENLTIAKNLTLKGAGVTSTVLDGGGTDTVVKVQNATVTLMNLTIQNGKTVSGLGGGIYDNGTLTLKRVNVSGNTAETGGGISNGHQLKLVKVNITGNTATLYGGGFHNNGGHATLKDVTISGNHSPYATGIANGGTIVFTRGTINDNINSAGGGAGISNFGTITLTNVTIARNHTSGGSAEGGGIGNGDTGTLTLTNVTIAGNVASGTGAGLYNANGGTVKFKNTIVAENTGLGNCGGTLTDLGHNLDSDNTCGLKVAKHDQIAVNPRLSPLANNGGFTQTMALMASSPAIDVGANNGCPTTDQRNKPRPEDGDGNGSKICDIGAYERQ